MADTRRPRARYTTGSAAGDRKVRAISFGAMFLEEENRRLSLQSWHCGLARPGSRPFCRVACVPAMSQRTALTGARTLHGRNSTSSSRTPIRSVGGPSVSSCKVEPIGKGAGLSRDAGTAAGDAVRARHPPARASPRDEAGAVGKVRHGSAGDVRIAAEGKCDAGLVAEGVARGKPAVPRSDAAGRASRHAMRRAAKPGRWGGQGGGSARSPLQPARHACRAARPRASCTPLERRFARDGPLTARRWRADCARAMPDVWPDPRAWRSRVLEQRLQEQRLQEQRLQEQRLLEEQSVRRSVRSARITSLCIAFARTTSPRCGRCSMAILTRRTC
jgi:hypothetical protein